MIDWTRPEGASRCIGSVLGGVIAQRFGITAPFWFGFAGSALILALIWRELVVIAHVPTATD